ncbi:MAG TPA: hypothetical protein VKB43_06240, partial [Gaiellaceae bacterium]|nr:hypothetical protein [Gaiellaceae bacterium]
MQTRSAIGLVVLALAAALAAGAPFAAAGHRVETQVRRTVSCTTEQKALKLWAFATNPTMGSANVTISTGN